MHTLFYIIQHIALVIQCGFVGIILYGGAHEGLIPEEEMAKFSRGNWICFFIVVLSGILGSL